jgi:hypothetical protein
MLLKLVKLFSIQHVEANTQHKEEVTEKKLFLITYFVLW